MFKHPQIAASVLLFGLLSACETLTTQHSLEMRPLLRVKDSSPPTAAGYYQLGKYHQDRGQFDLAAQAFTQSIALSGGQFEPRNALATILARQGKLDEAKSMLMQLILAYPQEKNAVNNLGYVYYLQGNYEAAVSTLQQALMLAPADQQASNNLKLAMAALGLRSELAKITAAMAVPAAAPTSPQTRMELVQVNPNVYQLKLKNDAGPVQIAASLTAPVPTTALDGNAPRVEVSNGNGVTGMAKRIEQLLAQKGITVSRITNDLPYNQQYTKIQYRSGCEQQAVVLRNVLQGHAVMEPVGNLSSRSDVRVVLGKDARLSMALIEQIGRASGTASGPAAT